MDFPDHPFWDFSLEVYHREGVGAACLHLQERHAIDVNVVLFCLWLGESGRGVMTGDELAALAGAVEDWHKVVVRGLRAVRATLKQDFSDVPKKLREHVRGEVQKAEIDAEHLEQLLLAAAVERPVAPEARGLEDRARDAAANVDLYLDRRGVRFEPADTVQFAHVLGQTFEGLSARRALDIAEILM
jgi:uncharacterized protein (TIGR02444 family)